jgi:hypothetical protein
MIRKQTILCLIALIAVGMVAVPSVRGQATRKLHRDDSPTYQTDKQRLPKGEHAKKSPSSDVAALERLSLILGRPTDQSITVSVLSADGIEGYCEYGITSGHYSYKTSVVGFTSGKPIEVLLDQLPIDKQCYYRLRYRKPGDKAFVAGAEHSFHTQRSPGSTFIYEIQGDSHPERPQQYDPELYGQTLRAAAADRPDFYVTIGDDFSVDKLRDINAETIDKIYLNHRYLLGLVAQSSPLFLVNGNHEQAAACNLDGTSDNVAVWAQTARNRFFPQPAPDGFYTGDMMPVKYIGPLRDYYAWMWGDALFMVIDPYWHSLQPVDNVFGGGAKNRDMWAITIGDEQYKWLKKTLESSKAKYKFVFTHHVLGTGRGGIENADLFEWGGRNKRGDWEFGQKRHGWEMPIHQLMAKNGVTIVFQGHDHVFVQQQLDGVVYQTLPEPADPNYTLYNKDAFHTGDVLPNSGRVRVTVAPEKVIVEYIRSWLPKDEIEQHKDREVTYQYSIPAISYGDRLHHK